MQELQTKQVIQITVNDQRKEIYVRNSNTLLDTLREQLGLMGAKPGCKNGDCGSCTVLIDGVPINACHILSVETVGYKVTTIEGLVDQSIQQEFIKNWAIQCGYCSPGFILNGYALVSNNPDADDSVIDEWLESNICRCTGYQEIKEAVKSVLSLGKKNS